MKITVVIIAYVMFTQEYSKKKKETQMTPRNDYDILV